MFTSHQGDFIIIHDPSPHLVSVLIAQSDKEKADVMVMGWLELLNCVKKQGS